MKLLFTAAARADLHAIGGWIASDNARRAVTFVDELEQHCAKLAAKPQMHPLLLRHPQTGIRKAVHGNYLIFYRVAERRWKSLAFCMARKIGNNCCSMTGAEKNEEDKRIHPPQRNPPIHQWFFGRAAGYAFG